MLSSIKINEPNVNRIFRDLVCTINNIIHLLNLQKNSLNRPVRDINKP